MDSGMIDGTFGEEWDNRCSIWDLLAFRKYLGSAENAFYDKLEWPFASN